jgi:thymidine kinase
VPTVSVLKKKGLDTVISTLDYYDTGKWFGLSQFANSGLPNYTVKDLLNLADVSELVQGKCAMPYGNRRTCDKPSRYTYSMEPKTSAVEVGKEKYCSFCDHHYALARNVGLQPWQKAALKIAASEYDIKHPDRTLRMIESPPRRAE